MAGSFAKMMRKRLLLGCSVYFVTRVTCKREAHHHLKPPWLYNGDTRMLEHMELSM